MTPFRILVLADSFASAPKLRFEWYVSEEGSSPGAKYYREDLDEDEKDELTALFEFLAECND